MFPFIFNDRTSVKVCMLFSCVLICGNAPALYESYLTSV